MIKILSLILFLLLLLVGKKQGLKTFICFYLSYFLLIIYIVFMGYGFNAIIVSLIICVIESLISLFLLNGYNIKTKASFMSITIVLIIMFIIIFLIGKHANIQGFSYESIESIGIFMFDINYNMTDVIIGMYLVCTIGTIIDTSISISSSINEIYENNRKLSQNELFESAMNIGRDILATTINTLYFALIASFIAFFIWHRAESIEYIINYKVFAQDVIELLLCFIASILIIPITSYICSNKLINSDKQK
ncbi:MAG: YibE/F family protein [Bacilli bacterium]|nr:YibE/F family protein [Bacilli bacterium]